MRAAIVGVLLVGCSSPATTMPGSDASSSPDVATMMPTHDASPIDASTKTDASVDVDGDGLDDALESKWAADYFPFLSIHPSDACPRHGVVYRLSPHPKDATKITIWYDVLYENDCGAAGHVGDDEVFGVIADPKIAGAKGILAVRAISHQGTPCEHTTTCGQCKGMSTCDTSTRNGEMVPVVYPSKDKHGSYVSKGTCDTSFLCDFGGCSLASKVPSTPLVNAGEPTKPLVKDLTDEGFIRPENGWTKMELFHFDPWKAGSFGSAGDVSKDLIDPAFVIDPCAI